MTINCATSSAALPDQHVPKDTRWDHQILNLPVFWNAGLTRRRNPFGMVKYAIYLTYVRFSSLPYLSMEENTWFKKLLPTLTQLLTQIVVLWYIILLTTMIANLSAFMKITAVQSGQSPSTESRTVLPLSRLKHKNKQTVSTGNSAIFNYRNSIALREKKQ